MSERQAKKIRKEQMTEQVKAPKDKGKIIFYVVAVILILAMAVLAGYAIGKKIESTPDKEPTEQAADSATTPNVDTSTLGGYAEAMGMTYDEMVEKYGLVAESFNADMPTEEAINMFTLENIAKMSEKDIETFKTELALPADVQTNVPSSELSTAVMMKVGGYPYTLEDLRAYGLPAEITEETKWADAQEAVGAAANAKYSAEAENTAAEGAEAAPAEGTEAETAPATEETAETTETAANDGGAE